MLLKDDIVVERASVNNFELAVPDAPGLGVILDEDKLAYYRRDRDRSALVQVPVKV